MIILSNNGVTRLSDKLYVPFIFGIRLRVKRNGLIFRLFYRKISRDVGKRKRVIKYEEH